MRRSNVDVPGYETSEIYTSAGAALLLPTCEVEALDAAREAERRARADAVEAIVRDVAARRAADTDKQGGDPMDRAEGACRKIFDVDEVNETLEIHGKGDRERLAQLKSWAGKMCRDEGYRRVQPFPDRLDVLREEFPNFSRVIDGIESLVALSAGSEGSLVPEPMLLAGPPGIGKTLFAESLATMVGVDLEVVSLAAAQGSFQILGTSMHWSTASPGQVWRLLATGHAANGVLLLDEIDKARGDERCLTEMALLDLLDPRTAKRIVDQAVDVTMDASALWKLGTANNLNAISEPVRSRVEVFEIEPPSRAELIEIYLRQWDRHCDEHQVRLELSAALLARMADIQMSPRAASRMLKFTLGRAVRDGVSLVDDLFGGGVAARRSIGFSGGH